MTPEELEQRPISYVVDGVSYYRASGSGRCLRAIVASRSYDAYPMSERTEEIVAEGELHEEAVLTKLREDGWTVEEPQKEVTLWVVRGKIAIVGHLDAGRMLPPRGRKERILEVKSMSKDVFKRWEKQGFEAFPRYATQLSIYMHATGQDAYFATKNRNDGRLEIIEITTPPVELREIKARIRKAESLILRDELPPCDQLTWGCPFWYLHEEEEEGKEEPTPDEVTERLEEWAAMYLEAKDREDAAKMEKREAGEKLRSIMEEIGQSSFRLDDGTTIIRVKDDDRKRLDRGMLEEDLGAKIKKYLKPSPVDYAYAKRARK